MISHPFRIAAPALLLIGGLLVTSLVNAQALAPEEQAIVSYVEAHVDEQIDLLERVVNVNSGTLNQEGVREVGRIFAEEFEAIGMTTEWVALPDSLERAGHLFARTRGTGAGKRVLLIGHLDTVFEPDDPFQTFERHVDTAVGPGVNDMKGGDVIILYALKALQAVGVLDDVAITVALIGDEENPGNVAVSRAPLIEAARESDVALGFETAIGMEWGTVARRGASMWSLEVTGRQRHSSGIFDEATGAGAIYEAARILDAFYSHLRGEQYLTFNPGVILGGTTVEYDRATSSGSAFGKFNVVPNRVVVEGDLRFISRDQLERARDRMRSIVETNNLPHTSARITFRDGYPAMPPTAGNLNLLKLLDEASQDLGLGPVKPWDPGKRGAADVSFVAESVDALDGLGAMGENDHSPGESIDLTTLPALTARAAVLVWRLAAAGGGGE
ncbi:MAG TPA: M20/M25/M40 family metallo-hydrolase [Rhodothermales bacterium]